MLELKDASLSVGGRQLFQKLSFMALDGQMTCITGPASSGKTALTMVMIGVQSLDEGLVSIDGELLTPLSATAFRRLMAYIPQKTEVAIMPFNANLTGLETVWSPYSGGRYHLTPIDEHLDIPPIASKPIIIADDPARAMLNTLKSLANDGHTVIVTSQNEEYINISDKILTLGKHDTVIS